MQNWDLVVGLEVHAQVISKSKLFSSAPVHSNAEPNTNVTFFDAGFPGTLPVLNEFCIEQGIKTGLALNGEISEKIIFDRKHYFYPDLPAGYQITQFYHPIMQNGFLEINGKKIRIKQLHLEQDAGKSMHDISPTESYINLNRAGVALMEIVTHPDITSGAEAAEYLRALRLLLRYIETCDGNMDEGSLRCDANVSVKPKGSDRLGNRCEIKNLNSIRFIEQAIECEALRQIKILENSGEIKQQTLSFDSQAKTTKPMRDKETEADYRYFADPDLPPIVTPVDVMQRVKSNMPELPVMKKTRYMRDFDISAYDADVIVSDFDLMKFFEVLTQKCNPKLSATWLTVELIGRLNKLDLALRDSIVQAKQLSELIAKIEDRSISGKLAKQVLDEMLKSHKSANEVIQDLGLQQISDESELRKIACEIINDNPQQVALFQSGKDRLFGFFVGQMMQRTKGSANPKIVNEILSEMLKA